MNRILRTLAPPALAVAVAACGGAPREPATPTPLPALATLQVEAGGTGARSWDGVVEAVQQATLTAQTAGRVTAVAHDVGDRVAAGEVLVRLSGVEQQAGVDAARARLRLAEATWRRMAALAEQRYVSQLQLDQARAEMEAARAQLAGLGQQQAYTTVRAPYAGIVSARRVEPGESVDTGQPLLALFAPGTLRVEVSVPQTEADAIRARPTATVQLPDGRRVESAAVTVFPAADPASHAVRVRVGLPPLDPPLWPGTTAKVAFHAAAGRGLPQVPASALLRQGELSAAYVVADGRLQLRQLRLGARDGEVYEVVAGLAAGETIAADAVAARQALAAMRGKD